MLAIFATDNKFNIKDDTNAGSDEKRPKKPTIWDYLFWITLLILIGTIVWSAFTSHAETQVIKYYQQQDTSTTTNPGITGGNIGQSNFTLNDTASSTLYYLTAHLKYNNSGNTGQTHKICVSKMIPVDSSWYINTPIGCFQRVIGASDFTAAADYQFIATSSAGISLPSSDYYAFFNAGVATSTNPYDILEGINNMPSLWYGSPVETAYGGDNLAGSAAFNTSWPSGLMFKNSPETGYYYGVADMFFIINAGVPVGGGNPVPTSCEGGGVFDTLLCNLYVSLFIPSDTALNQFSGLWDNIKNKPPFGYAVAINTAISDIAIGTTTLAFAGISEISFFNTMRNVLTTLFWFLFIFWIFHRLRNFNF